MTSYRGISDYHSNKMVISTSAMKKLYGDLNFQQIRFYCRKHNVGRTFHVITATNSSGNAVVQYLLMLNQPLVGRLWEWRMIPRHWQGDAVIGILAHLVNGRAIMEAGIMLCKDSIITLPGFLATIIGTLWWESLSSAMILVNHSPLVIFGECSSVKENDNAFNDFLFCVNFYCNCN